ncbi:MAG TPA: DUF3016 domain-containing protein [Candidatus Limnocylindria bacterium]|nr:DUF3016 domain-containing protein [Candidatus Limnocylindria bacterium]
MNRRSRTISAIALVLVAGCAAAAPVEESAARISVAFIDPEKFTDARRAELEPTSAGVVGELQKFIITTGARYMPENMKMNIRVTDIDLAGDFELFRGPTADQVRIVKGLYPPHIVLEFEIVDSAATVIKSGKRDLTDINYQLRSVYPREDHLRYEKDILRDWLRAELGVLKTAKTN